MIALELDSRRRIARRGDASVRLGPIGFKILELLARAPDGLEREAIFERGFLGRDDPPTDDCLSVHISILRRKIAALRLEISKCDRWGGVYQIMEGAE
jgi:DNA-binding response OmpR family regulator